MGATTSTSYNLHKKEKSQYTEKNEESYTRISSFSEYPKSPSNLKSPSYLKSPSNLKYPSNLKSPSNGIPKSGKSKVRFELKEEFTFDEHEENCTHKRGSFLFVFPLGEGPKGSLLCFFKIIILMIITNCTKNAIKTRQINN